MEALGFDSIAVKQSARELNDPTVDFRLELEAGHVEHDGNEATKWSIANAKTTSNSFGEIKIDKEYATERIDIVDAIIDAWMMAMKGEIKPDVNRYLDIWFAGTEKLRQKGGAQG